MSRLPKPSRLPPPTTLVEPEKENLKKDGQKQLNIRLDPDVHHEIKVAALQHREPIADYVLRCIRFYQDPANHKR